MVAMSVGLVRLYFKHSFISLLLLLLFSFQIETAVMEQRTRK